MKCFSLLTLFLVFSLVSYSQKSQNSNSELKIYVDCQFCDEDYFRQNMNHVEFVRDRKVADVHLLFSRQRNGSGGFTQNIQFIGLGEFEKRMDTLYFSTNMNMTNDEKRKLQQKYIELGLVSFWLKKGLAEKITLNIEQKLTEADSIKKDPWNYWVFGLNIGGWANGQETSHSINTNSTISAKRITEKNKFSMRARYNKNFQKFIYDSTITTANQQSSWVNIQEVLAINEHWSYGFFTNVGNSIFSNQRFYCKPNAGIEYNLFNYKESSTKQIVLSYNAGALGNIYYDTTVFYKDQEVVGFQKIQVAGTIIQQWGSFSGSASWQHYLHDIHLNSTSFWLNLKVRLFKGFSWRINGSFNILHDQINLKKDAASLEDVLLQQQQLGSGYSYWLNTGINYSFGSIYNSIVNPRFDF